MGTMGTSKLQAPILLVNLNIRMYTNGIFEIIQNINNKILNLLQLCEINHNKYFIFMVSLDCKQDR